MRRVALGCVLAVLTTLGLVLEHPLAASALSGSDFKAGYIISDAIFYNSSAMTAAQVQSFIASKETNCTTSMCMQNYRMTTPTVAPDSTPGLCNGYAGVTNELASNIIAKVAVSCGVNPQSLLALIQKESGLVATSTPPQNYDMVTGAFCPDTTGCDPAHAGFFNQVYGAARQFKLYRVYPNNYNFVAGRTNTILYNPNTACGSSPVYIQNQATAGLYDYTPYQPNAAALANLYGTGDSCSAYGNRNFWVLFNNWFGSTGTATFPLAANSSPVGVATGTGFQYAMVGTSGTLWLSGPAGSGDLHLGVAAGTSPSIAAVAGGIQLAFQAAGGHLWTVGALGNQDFGVSVAPGTSPSITAVGTGYEIAYQGTDTALYLIGTAGTGRLPLGMASGSSPSITSVKGGYEVAFEANTTALWLVGAWGNLNTGLGMDSRSSPSIAAVSGTGIQVAFQANSHTLWVIGNLGNSSTGRPMAAGSSPSIMTTSAGWEVAFAGSDTTLWETGALGTANPQLGVRPGTSPSIAPYQGGARITMQGGDGLLWTYGAGGAGQVMATT